MLTNPHFSRQKRGSRCLLVYICIFVSSTIFGETLAQADDYQTKAITAATPSLNPPFEKLFEEQGAQVIRGTSRSVCKIWLARKLPTDATAKDGYPLKVGGLVGVVEYTRKSRDFRDQEIPKGVYTLRYARIPTDGAHEGTSPTSDFLVLVAAQQDKSPTPLEIEDLIEKSSGSIDSSHPCILALKSPRGKAQPSMHHEEEHDWWMLQVNGRTASGSNTKELSLCIVVAGFAEE